MLVNYGSEIEYITREFDKKARKKLSIDSLISLNKKLIDLEDQDIEKSMIELKRILRNIADKEPKQYRVYRKEFEVLKKYVIEKFGFHQKGSITAKYVGLGLVFGVAFGASFTSLLATSSGVGIAVGMAIGSAIGTRKEKVEEEAGNLY